VGTAHEETHGDEMKNFLLACMLTVAMVGCGNTAVRGVVVGVSSSSLDIKNSTGTIKHYQFWFSSSPDLEKLIRVGDEIELVYRRDFDDSSFGTFGSVNVTKRANCEAICPKPYGCIVSGCGTMFDQMECK
jgi:hypothetical protein